MSGDQRILIRIEAENRASKEFDKFNKSLLNGKKKMAGWNKSTKELKKRSLKLEGIMKSLQKSMLGVGLSFMFAGMALRKAATDMIRGAVDAFTKIMESSGLAGSAIQVLSVWFEYLKFTIGNAISTALEPLMPLIITIVQWLARWVNKHKTLTTIILLGALALGAMMMVGGQLILFLMGLTFVGPMFAAIGTALTGLGFIFWWILGIIIVVVLLWKSNFAGFKGWMTETFNAIKDMIEGVFNSIKTIVGGIWQAIMGFMEGDWDKMWTGLIKASVGFVMLLANVFMGLVTIIQGIMGFITEAVVTTFMNMLGFITDAFVKLLNLVSAALAAAGMSELAGHIKDVANRIASEQQAQKNFVIGKVHGAMENQMATSRAVQEGIKDVTINISNITTDDPMTFVDEVGRIIVEEIQKRV